MKFFSLQPLPNRIRVSSLVVSFTINVLQPYLMLKIERMFTNPDVTATILASTGKRGVSLEVVFDKLEKRGMFAAMIAGWMMEVEEFRADVEAGEKGDQFRGPDPSPRRTQAASQLSATLNRTETKHVNNIVMRKVDV